VVKMGKSNCKMHTLQRRGRGENGQANKWNPTLQMQHMWKNLPNTIHKQRCYTPN